MTASMQVVDTPIDDVVVKFRLRSPSDKKVFEIAESINQIGSLINPITIDKHNNLLAGFHRFLAYKNRFTIQCKFSSNVSEHFLQNKNFVKKTKVFHLQETN